VVTVAEGAAEDGVQDFVKKPEVSAERKQQWKEKGFRTLDGSVPKQTAAQKIEESMPSLEGEVEVKPKPFA